MAFLITSTIVWIMRDKYNLNWCKTIVFFLVGVKGLNFIFGTIEVMFYIYNPSSLTLFIIPVILVIFLYLKRDTEGKYIQEWKNTSFPRISSFQFSNDLVNYCDTNNVRYYKNIPYNRAKYFSSGTEADIDMNLVSNIFYDAKPAENEMSFQEYGFLVTSLGVIVNKQIILLKEGRKKLLILRRLIYLLQMLTGLKQQ